MTANFDFDKVAQEAMKALEQGRNGHVQMTFPVEWFQEDMPLENKSGDALDNVVQELLNTTFRVSKTLENFVKPKEAPPQLPPPPPPKKETILVFSDAHGLAKKIIDAAPEGRISTKKFVENTYELEQADMSELIGKKGWDTIVFACGLDPPASNSVADVIEQNTIMTKAFFYLNQLITRNDKACKKFVVITRGVFEECSKVHKKAGLGITVAGNLFGMCNTARQEFENSSVQYIDTEYYPKDDSLWPRIASEILREGSVGHNSVRILHTGRFVARQLSSKEYEKAGQEFLLPSEGTIAITGGNGALALVMGEWLLKTAEDQGATGFSIKFLSRSMRISDDNMPTWKRIQGKAAQLGIQVEQARSDISSQEATDELISSLTPDLVGIIHSAGLLQDSMLMNLTWEKCEAVFDPKHRAALYLHGALERFKNPKLRFFWMFSSIAVYGNMGQWNYSGSNAFLDGIARHRIARNKVATAIQWGAWGEVGMAANLDQASRKRTEMGPMPYFTNAEGLAGLEAGLSTGLPYFSVYKTNPPIFFGMCQPCDTPSQNYIRNFYSELFPTNIAPTLDRKHHMTILRTAQGAYAKRVGKKRMVFDSYVVPKAAENDRIW
eukprot:CAMPEP_0206444674 /NCGR_PEP_ID=MMETSP0324_2-20121206/15049_1 /ASSEMBLY_ACC=CAM_ASM_000836 /TAXON_ID=2866 /ORGANISM="Crypthecodinium cohnii, Strain Seligo" /LENGTH=609 /DNA_ID=CAMNT_0053912735 /DNA_START=145 /DNA_END=1971 /DNA_ORIENTATION=+